MPTLRPTSDRPAVLIRVLGPVDAVVDGAADTLGSRLERKLLAALAVSANHAVSSDELCQILWGDRPPPSRDNTLQTYVARLRSAIGRDLIVSEDDSYALQVFAHELDAGRFDALASEAASQLNRDPSACRAACREALALWRGVPFGAFSVEDPFRLEAIRLDETRVFLTEMTIACELALGNEGLVVGALEALVTEYPYRERLWRLLIAALALCGRRVEALRACDHFGKVLGDVGLEPARELRALEHEILSERADLRARLLARLRGPR